jgi:hypothetical protein
MDETRAAAPASQAPRPRRARWPALLAGLVLLAGGAASWWVLKAPSAVTPATAPAPEAAAPAGPAGPVLSSAESDALLRERLSGLSSQPEWAAWLTEADLLRRFVGVVAAVGEGESPRALVGFLSPRGEFHVREAGRGRLVVDPRAYARYDAIGRVVASLDAAALASAYRDVAPTVDALYAEGARPGSTFRQALGRAFDRVLAVPLLEGEVEVVQKGAVYVYADPALEGLTAADKHLLRLGPTTLKALQEQVRAVAGVLDVPLTGETAAR